MTSEQHIRLTETGAPSEGADDAGREGRQSLPQRSTGDSYNPFLTLDTEMIGKRHGRMRHIGAIADELIGRHLPQHPIEKKHDGAGDGPADEICEGKPAKASP